MHQRHLHLLTMGFALLALAYAPAFSDAAIESPKNSAPEKELHIEGIAPENDSLEKIQKTASSKEEEIERLEKLKEYYESNIRRLSRTAWRLEFKDPGYSRILDQRVAQLQKKLDAVNKRLNDLK